eukprot:11741880-Karenia_brevis.AAC.1
MAPKTWKCRGCSNVNPWSAWNCNACRGAFQHDQHHKKKWSGWVDYDTSADDRPTTRAAEVAAVKDEQVGESAALPPKRLSSMAAMLEAKKMLDEA